MLLTLSFCRHKFRLADTRDIGTFPPLCPGTGGGRSSNPPSSRPGSPTNLTRSPSSSSSPPPHLPPKSFSPSIITPGATPSPQPPQPTSSPFSVVDYPPGFSGHPLARPPVQGFQTTRMADDPRRKSSSTMTTMTSMTTTTAAHDFTPGMNHTTQSGYGSNSSSGQRGYSTMPNQRQSMPVPSAYTPPGGLTRSPSYGSSIHHPTSPPQVEYSPNPNTYSASEGGHGMGNDEWRTKRFSSATNMTFGPMPGRRDGLESLAEHDTVRTSHVAWGCLVSFTCSLHRTISVTGGPQNSAQIE